MDTEQRFPHSERVADRRPSAGIMKWSGKRGEDTGPTESAIFHFFVPPAFFGPRRGENFNVRSKPPCSSISMCCCRYTYLMASRAA